MSFAEHLRADANGELDLAAAEADYAEQLRADPDALEAVILSAAKQGRRSWESENRKSLGKLFQQPPLSPELSETQPVPLGNDKAIEYGRMTQPVIQQRKDLRTKKHLEELDAFQLEIRHWHGTESLLNSGETISDAIRRQP